jgi:hypothetical protein
MRRPSVRAVARVLSPLIPLVAAAVVWRSLLDNYFLSDDFLSLFDLVTLPLPHFFTQIFGGHLYIVRNVVFAAMYGAFGPEPRPWFWSVLLTHLLNVFLLHRVVLRVTGDRLLACLGATLWGTSPVLEGALGWYSVYGHVLLTTFVLVVLASLAGAVAAGRPPSPRRALVWGGLLAVGATCFGTGLGIAAAFPVVVALAFPPDRRSARAAGVLVLTAVAMLAVYAVVRTWSPDLDARGRELLAPGTILGDAPAVLALGASLLVYGASTLLLGPLGLDAGYPDAASLGAPPMAPAAGASSGSARSWSRRAPRSPQDEPRSSRRGTSRSRAPPRGLATTTSRSRSSPCSSALHSARCVCGPALPACSSPGAPSSGSRPASSCSPSGRTRSTTTMPSGPRPPPWCGRSTRPSPPHRRGPP